MLSRTAIPLSLVLMMFDAGCGRQVSDEYLGEPLLSLRGQVTSVALSAAPDAAPALCFRYFTGDPFTRHDQLPADIQESLGEPNLILGDPYDVHILDVESRGNFPAEFAIDVLQRPDSGTLAPLVTGEPPSAFGAVCAVTAGHASKERELRTMGSQTCLEDGGGCNGFNLRVNRDSSRYFLERYECAAGATSPGDCEVMTEGEELLKQESGGYESVLEQNYEVQVIYLAEPATAGSYTAYKAGAPEGLPAGYHVRTLPAFSMATPEVCFGSWYDAALKEFNDEYGTKYEFESEVYATGSAEKVAFFRDVNARLEMEACPIEHVETKSASTDKLSLTLMPEDHWVGPLPTLGPP